MDTPDDATTTTTTSFDDIPRELRRYILSQLDGHSLATLICATKGLQELGTNNALWEQCFKVRRTNQHTCAHWGTSAGL